MDFSFGDTDIIGVAITREELTVLTAGMMFASTVSPNPAIDKLAQELTLAHLRAGVEVGE